MIQRSFPDIDAGLDDEGHAGLERPVSLADIVHVHADPVAGAVGVPGSILIPGSVGNEAKIQQGLLHDLDGG